MSVAQGLIGSSDERPIAIEPFRFNREKLGQPSSFEFRFLLRDRVFIYGFDVTARRIVGEWLGVLRDTDELTIFERDEQGITRIESKAERYFSDDATLFKTISLLAQLPLTGNQLFLSRIRSLPPRSQGETLSSVLRWLTQDLVILGAQHRAVETLDRLFVDREFLKFSSHFLERAGTGIGSLEIIEIKRKPTDRDRLAAGPNSYSALRSDAFNRVSGSPNSSVFYPDDEQDDIEQSLLATHESKNAEYSLPFSEESDGTQQLLHFMPVLSPSEPNKVFVIDELDRSLHPLLCWELIRFFSESMPGARKQLIVTTHEAHLLDQKLLRRDEYWFVEKDAAQQSRLVSLSDFNIRNDLLIEKGYLQGRFGAIPLIGPMKELERLLAQPGTEESAAEKAPA